MPAISEVAPMIRRRDLQRALGVSSETMRQWIKARRLPPFDVYVSDRECWWRSDTLAAAGFNVVAPQDQASASPPTPAAS